MCFSLVLPILYNAVQCLLVRYRLLRSLPSAARTFFNLHPNPVGGTVLCSFKAPEFNFEDVLVDLARGRAQINIRSLPYVERQGLATSWMRLIQAIDLETRHKKQFQRIIVDSSLDVDPVAINCSWKSFAYLALGLGVNPIDPTFHGLGRGKDAVDEQSLHSTALHSETGQRLIELRWHQGTPCLELTEQCSSWSLRRSLAQFLHMITVCDGRQEILHFVPVVFETSKTPISQICDCKNTTLDPVKFSTLRNIHYAITWTLYFEEILHQIPYEEIPIPQSLLLHQFEITEELHQTPAETLQSRISTIFPSHATLVANIMSALTSTWSSSEHQQLLNGLSGGAHNLTPQSPRRLELNTTTQAAQFHSSNQTLDVEKATSAQEPSSKITECTRFDLYTALHSSPTFHSLSQTYSPSAIPTNSNRAVSSAPPTATIDIDDQSTPEALLARLIIALSAMRRSTAPKGWVTSIASGALKYKVGPEAGEDMVGRLLRYEGGTIRIE